MALYYYSKKESSPKTKIITITSYGSLLIGTLLLFWAFYPIISFKLYSHFFISKKFDSPVPTSDVVNSIEQANSILGTKDVYSNNLRDFTNVSLWFPTVAQSVIDESREKIIDITEYTLSIPKLNIKDAKVIIGGDDLSNSLVHYLPRSLPGEFGNVVIFGHSTLPQLYNPKDYKTIFTYLPTLEKGDKILVKVKQLEYEYEIYDMFVINPQQISVLEERNDEAYMTLITCVPPGTYWERLVVRSKLVRLPQRISTID